jgi:hypothetical protein
LPLFRGDNAETLLFRQASIEKMGHLLKKISPGQLLEVFSCAQIISRNRQNSIMKDGIFGLSLWHFFHLLRYYPPCWKPKTLGTEIAGEWGMVERELSPSRNKNLCTVAQKSTDVCVGLHRISPSEARRRLLWHFCAMLSPPLWNTLCDLGKGKTAGS